jgi:hypothetical protein
MEAAAQRKKAAAQGDDAGVAAVDDKLKQLVVEHKEDQLQLDLMRELIDTVRTTAREGIAEDRQGVEQMIEESESVSQRGLAEEHDEMEALQETLQREMIGDEAESTGGEVHRFQNRKTIEKGVQEAVKMASQDNEIYMAAAVVAAIPLVGQGLSQIAGKFLSKGEELERSAGGVYGITGVYGGPQYDKDKGEYTKGIGYDMAADYGKTQAEFLAEFMNPLARQIGQRATESEGMYALKASAGLSHSMQS